MLKKRIVACLVIKNGIVVQSINFKRYLPVGKCAVSVEFLNRWGIDEIVMLDIDASAEKRGPDFNMVSEVSRKSFVPLTVGGGIQNLDDIRRLIHCGADKVSINKIALTKPSFIKEAAEVFGSQCIVVSIDAKIDDLGRYEVFSDSGRIPTGLDPAEWAKRAEKLGAGEILLNSVDRDGSRQGYDVNLVRMVSEAVNIPVIVCGGAGRPRHFLEAIVDGRAYAVAAANFFHFTEHSPILVKAYVRQHGIDIRLDTYAHYKEADFSDSGRLNKKSETMLEKLRFEYIPEEAI